MLKGFLSPHASWFHDIEDIDSLITHKNNFISDMIPINYDMLV